MRYGHDETCLDHDTGPRHPETSDRVRAVRKHLSRKHEVRYHQVDPASVETVEAIHDSGYIATLQEFCEHGGGDWDPDTVASGDTWDAALTSAGLAQWAAEAAVSGADGRDTPFSIGRPPGHHAVADDAMGFCFINNAAVAAQTLLDDPEADVDRAVIFDWDVHHGNGTQDIFYDQGDALSASIHEEGLYPGTGEVDETGVGDGEGSTLNVPLAAGAGDADYLLVVEELLRPVVERYDPDLFIVSAGFDAHRHDPISRMRVSTEGYALLTDRVRSLADDVDAGLAFVLEGGYGLDTLSEGVAIVHETFDGREAMEPDDDPEAQTERLVEDVREAHDIDG